MKTTTRLSALLMLLCTFFIGQQAMAQGKTSSSDHEISNKELKEYAGNYKAEASPGFDITISLDGDDRLMAQPSDKSQPITLLRANAKDKFTLVNTGGLKISFNREDDKIISLTFSQGGQSFTAKREEE
ncbi:MAG: hypothetical protein HEP71_14915 [Roseivirga sp.]|nr:hypothetical protein [Roseivirga sp.]